MANSTDPFAQTVHGTNPQYLVEKITRLKIYNATYWKEECFGLTAATVLDKAARLKYVGGLFGGNLLPSKFLCLVLKLLQLQPEKEIVMEYIQQEDFKYVRALGAFYLRLTGRAEEIYRTLEPLYSDYRKLAYRGMDGWRLMHVDEFVDSLLRDELVCDIALPHMTKRVKLEGLGVLSPRVSLLEAELREMEEMEARALNGSFANGTQEDDSSVEEDPTEANDSLPPDRGEVAIAFDEDDEEDDGGDGEIKEKTMDVVKEQSKADGEDDDRKDQDQERKEKRTEDRHDRDGDQDRDRGRDRGRDRDRDRRRGSDSRDRYSRRHRSPSDSRHRARSRSDSRDRNRRHHRSSRREDRGRRGDRDDSDDDRYDRRRDRDSRRRDDSDRRRRHRSYSESSRDSYDHDRDSRKRSRRRSPSRSESRRRPRSLERQADREERARPTSSAREKDLPKEKEDAFVSTASTKPKPKFSDKTFDRIFGKKSSGAAATAQPAKTAGKVVINTKGEKVVITAPDGTVEYWNQMREALGMSKLK